MTESAAKDLDDMLMLLHFWKDPESTQQEKWIEQSRKEMKNDKSILFLQTLQFLVKLNTKPKEIKLKGISKLPTSSLEQREFVNTCIEMLSGVFPEMNLSKSSFTGNRTVDTLRNLALKTLANSCRGKSFSGEMFIFARNTLSEVEQVNHLKVLVANEVRKYMQLVAKAQKKRRNLLTALRQIHHLVKWILSERSLTKSNTEKLVDNNASSDDWESSTKRAVEQLSRLHDMFSSLSAEESFEVNPKFVINSGEIERYRMSMEEALIQLPIDDRLERTENVTTTDDVQQTDDIIADFRQIENFIKEIQSVI